MKTGTVKEMIDELKTEAAPFVEHLFTKDWQHRQEVQLKQNLPLAQYSAVQSAYYAQDSVTVHQ